MLKIVETTEAKVTKIECPKCNVKLPRTGLLDNSEIRGLVFKCKRCGCYWEVLTRRNKHNKPIVSVDAKAQKIDGKERTYEKG